MNNQTRSDLKPMSWGLSVLYFGIPALVTAIAFFWFRPLLESFGYSELKSYLAALCIPLALMFAAALIFYNRIEGHPFTRQAFADRMRYPRLRFSDVLWGIGITILGTVLGYGLLAPVNQYLIQSGIIPTPAGLPLLSDPKAVFSIDALNTSAGGSIRGQWDLVILFAITYFFNIAGEELWWRGYILPRQEVAFGRMTWLIHGTMWAFFHVFKWWDILLILPICILIGYVSQRRQNNWAAFIAHALTNISGPLLVLAAVAGWIR